MSKHETAQAHSFSKDSTAWADTAAASGLPRRDVADRLQALSASQPGRLVIGPETAPTAIEQYRRLGAVMFQAQANRRIKTCMVTSAFAAEGKSLSTANIALTLSESYRRRVLLIDADLRRPTLHDTFQIPNLAGVSDWLRSDSAVSGRLPPLVEITDHLTLLPGGRPNNDPMSGITSERMRHLLQMASERYDWVILDTPPVAFLPDGHLLANMVDTVVLVVVAGRTPAPAAQRAVEEIGRDKIIGVVLNRVAKATLQAYGQTSYYTSYRNAAAAPSVPREPRG
ncbi:MAG: CpsD/CapB family tyrosine-protein kinase [Vicinamibacterales bacterium]